MEKLKSPYSVLFAGLIVFTCYATYLFGFKAKETTFHDGVTSELYNAVALNLLVNAVDQKDFPSSIGPYSDFPVLAESEVAAAEEAVPVIED